MIKIKLGPDGRVAPETMKLLTELGEHVKQCPTCAAGKAHGTYCPVGMKVIEQLCARPDVFDGADDPSTN